MQRTRISRSLPRRGLQSQNFHRLEICSELNCRSLHPHHSNPLLLPDSIHHLSPLLLPIHLPLKLFDFLLWHQQSILLPLILLMVPLISDLCNHQQPSLFQEFFSLLPIIQSASAQSSLLLILVISTTIMTTTRSPRPGPMPIHSLI